MRPVIDFPKLRHAHMHIDLGSGQVSMSQEFLHMADISSVINHMCSSSVAVLVAGTGFADI